MKKFLAPALALLLVLTLDACGQAGWPEAGPELPLLGYEEISAWPENKYTSAIVRPEVGTPYAATVYDEAAGYFAVSLNNATREQSEEYVKLLVKNGFEPFWGKSEIAAAVEMLQKGDVQVSVTASGDGFGIYIRLLQGQ